MFYILMETDSILVLTRVRKYSHRVTLHHM